MTQAEFGDNISWNWCVSVACAAGRLSLIHKNTNPWVQARQWEAAWEATMGATWEATLAPPKPPAPGLRWEEAQQVPTCSDPDLCLTVGSLCLALFFIWWNNSIPSPLCLLQTIKIRKPLPPGNQTSCSIHPMIWTDFSVEKEAFVHTNPSPEPQEVLSPHGHVAVWTHG